MTRDRASHLFLAAAAIGLFAAPAFAQDAAAGGEVFKSQCGVCHDAQKPAHNKIGPSLLGVVGRKAGTAPGFNYSAAMKAYAKPWTPANLDAFLTAPRSVVATTSMTFYGVKDAAKRANLIAFLKQQK